MRIYIKVNDSTCVGEKKVKLADVASIYCRDQRIQTKANQRKLYQFKGGENAREVFSILKVVEALEEMDDSLDIINMGPEDFVVYYKEGKAESAFVHRAKIWFVALVAFLGAGFSIMAYNTDVGINELFGHVYKLVMGKEANGPTLLHVSYTLGLAVGIIVFFNHAGKMKLSKEPTPLEVQMRLYERDVNDTLVVDADRKGEEADVDS